MLMGQYPAPAAMMIHRPQMYYDNLTPRIRKHMALRDANRADPEIRDDLDEVRAEARAVGEWSVFQAEAASLTYSDVVEYTTPIIKALNGLPVYYRHHIKNGLALGKGLKIIRYQDFTKKRKQTQKRKETKRNEGRVNKKRRVEDVEDVEVDKKRSVEDVEKLEDVFASFNIEDDDVPDRQYIETHGVVHPDV